MTPHFGTQTGTFAPPRDGASEGHLKLTRGGTHLTIRAGEIDQLCRAEFTGVVPKSAARGGHAAIAYPRFSFAGLLRRPHRAEIELNPGLPWSLAFVGGVGDSSLDLRGLELRGLEIAGGVAGLRVVLPSPHGPVGVRIAGGATRVTVLRPADVAAGLRIAGGASRLAFDGERYGVIGGQTRLETRGGDENDRYKIEISGGASDLAIAEQEGPEER